MNLVGQTTKKRIAAKSRAAAPFRPRSSSRLLEPLQAIARNSASLLVDKAGSFEAQEKHHAIDRAIFIGPQGGDEPIRIGIFAGIHGDEPAGTHAAVRLLELLERNPQLATGYCLFVYPVCNPTGFETGSRHSHRGLDLNREFWNGSAEPEVQILEQELRTQKFHGLISLHADDTSDGLYGFVGGATLTKHLIDPALKAAEEFLPRNQNAIIDGFNARNGIIKEGYPGILSAPPGSRPKPFELILETPEAAPQYLQENALLAAMLSVLQEYRQFMAFAPNL